jgi:hypothetical protein
MATSLITPELKAKLETFLSRKRSADLLTTYLYFLEQRYLLKPVVFPQGKIIYQSAEEAIRRLESEGKLWHEAEIRINFSDEAVNDETKKIYICPFSGKVFGDNTHPNPQDAIYDWVAKCGENTERQGGLKVKRFYVSEDPDVIKNYIEKRTKPVTKKVFSSVVTGKLFNSRDAIINDFEQNHLKSIMLTDVQKQSRFDIEENFLQFVQDQLDESRVTAFVEELADYEELLPYVQRWLESE